MDAIRTGLRCAFLILVLMSIESAADAGLNAHGNSTALLSPHFGVGERVSFVFSRTRSVTVDGWPEYAGRISGTSSYIVKAIDASEVSLDSTYRLDGSPTNHDPLRIHLDGTSYCVGANCQANTDAGGILFNRLIWGTPPARLAVGTSWNAPIKQPWELGPPGAQTISVIAIDAQGESITLKREGTGEGETIDGPRTVKLQKDGRTIEARVAAGRTTWVGYTVFRRGIVVSDELTAESEVTVTGPDLNSVPARARQYILMNAAPPTFEGLASPG
jgi:hypothetical protein